MAATGKVIFVRHGESEWNLANLFCGWFDANLSEKGVEEAKAGGKGLKDAGYTEFDVAFTSRLTRAQVTLGHCLDGAYDGAPAAKEVPIVKTWRLNERHYGGLTGQDKVEAVEKFGEDQVKIWRRSFDTPPPTMDKDHKHYDSIRKHPDLEQEFAAGTITEDDLPASESLETTIKRTMPFWEKEILPAVKAGKKVLVAAHGNSLRGIVMFLDQMTQDEIMECNLPTGIPFVYELEFDDSERGFKVTKSMDFIGDEATVKEAIEKVKNQTAKKA
jgi:2,3-bisphosphoglycerate-dependent phosphoglycerate mutase